MDGTLAGAAEDKVSGRPLAKFQSLEAYNDIVFKTILTQLV